MMQVRMGPQGALIALLVAVVWTGTIPVSAGASTPSFCTSPGPILATAITSPIALSTCPIVGEQIVLPLPAGQVGNGVTVPTPGKGVENIATSTSGETELTAVNSAGVLTVTLSTYARGSAGTTVSNTDAACSETAYNYEGGLWVTTLNWYYNESSVSRSGLGVTATLDEVRQANANMTEGVNDCGYTGRFRAYGSFAGNTTKYANIDSSGDCTSSFPDGQNTVSWGPFYGNSDLAVTCIATAYPQGVHTIVEADIYLGSNVGLVTTLPSPCTTSYDLESITTHEWGHAYGMAHETSGDLETMYPYSYTCATLARTLANGDWHGMANLYGTS